MVPLLGRTVLLGSAAAAPTAPVDVKVRLAYGVLPDPLGNMAATVSAL